MAIPSMLQGDTGPIGSTIEPENLSPPQEKSPGQIYQGLTEEETMLKERFPQPKGGGGRARGPSPEAQQRVQEVRQKYEPMLSQPYDTFQPSKETAANFAGLGGLLMVMGAMSGSKGLVGATGAMNAMAGMLQGYQQGRKEVYEQERKAFETNFKIVQQNRALLKQEFDRALKEAQTDLPGATQRLSRRLKASGASALAATVEKSGITTAAASVNEASQNFDNQVQTYQQAPQRLAQIAAEKKRMLEQAKAQRQAQSIDRAAGVVQPKPQRERTVSVLDPNNPKQSILIPESQAIKAAQEGKPYTPAPRTGPSGPGGAVQFRYNQAVANATEVAAVDLAGYASSPLTATPPVADEVLTDPAKSLTEASKSYFAQRITPAEDRAVQKNLTGLIRAAANIQAGGRPGGVTESSLRELNKLAPRAGDAKINSFLFLAMMKQEFSIAVKDLKAAGANPEQIALAEKNEQLAKELVPWSVQDINRILRAGGPALVSPKTIDLIQRSQSRKDFEKGLSTRKQRTPQFESPEDVKSAFESGMIDRNTAQQILRDQFGFD